MSNDRNKEILALLSSKGLLKAEQVEEVMIALQTGKEDLTAFLITKNFIAEEELTKIKAEFYKLPYQAPLEVEIDESVLRFLPEEVAKTYKIICFGKEEDVLKIALVEPNLKAMEAVSFLVSGEKKRVNYYLISNSGWEKLFKQYQKIEEEISSALESRAEEEGDDLITVDTETSNLSSEDINSAPVSRIVSVIIRHAVEARASDIHIEPYAKESRVRYRIDGILHTSLSLPKSIHNAVISRVKVLAKLKLDETRIPQDGRIRLIVNNREVDFRISTLPLVSSEKVVMRILDTSKGAPSLEQLGFNKLALRKIREGIKKTSGIFLVTGPTGSGKTTTLYSILTIVNKEGVNISTLEDPIEYEIKGINQSQVRPKVGFSFASGLRSLLRQDPNIIMVGEVRDEETAELSIHASLTGHLVLSTLHTNDALGAVFRLLDMKIERFLLSSTLKTVIAQRLARKLCEHCKQETTLSVDALAEIRENLAGLPVNVLQEELPLATSLADVLEKYKIYQAVGCSRCDNTGYASRLAISEVIEINDSLKEIINKGQVLNFEAVCKSQEFVSIKQDGTIKVLQGQTTYEEVLRVIES
ncbi:type II/IV secretion system protein [Candidatus Falkowbacteria bacterium]|nr:type II/IV secretion system protein [Candidatus Falkowbacteria bacterium]NCT54368.1 type II/IV secretion system protein [Candidatus Falkowbacteria bacterium]